MSSFCASTLLPKNKNPSCYEGLKSCEKTLLYETAAHKILVKLKPLVNFTNIL